MSDENSELTPQQRSAAMYRAAMPANGDWTVQDRRASFEGMLAELPLSSSAEVTPLEGLSIGGWVVKDHDGPSERAGVLLHGGGYVIGSATGYRAYAAQISRATRSTVIVPEYRLAPEHPYPAGIDDAVEAILAAIEQFGVESTFVIGDSAGGGLTLSSMLALRDAGSPLPACQVLVSPLIDLTATNDSYRTKADVDPIVSQAGIRRSGGLYLDGRDATTAPLAFPMVTSLTGVPPCLLVVGTAEVLLDDSRHLAAKLDADRVPHEYLEYDDMVHVWPLFSSFLPEGREALAAAGRFVDRWTAAPAAKP